MRGLWLTAMAGCLVLALLPSHALCDDVRDRVAEGIRLFEKGKYDKAEEVFAEADSLLPRTPAIAFDRGCAFQARGEWDEAVHHYSVAAQARETGLAAAARFNLGTVNVEKAVEIFGESPESADPEKREQGLASLAAAAVHFRECLDVKPDHDGARRNLEAVRIWVRHMKALWEELDRQKLRDELDLLQFLEMMIKSQKQIQETMAVLIESQVSPRRRQAAWVLGRDQSRLADEIVFLKKKMTETLMPAGLPGSPGGEDPLVELHGLADGAGADMNRAADLLGTGSIDRSVDPQQGAVEKLERIKEIVESMNQEEENEPDLLQIIEKIQKSQLDIREATGRAADMGGSPERLDTIKKIEEEQRDLSRETGALDEKIEETLTPPEQATPGQAPPGQAQPPQPENDREQIEEAVTVLKNWAKEAEEAMAQAADDLAAGSPGEARDPQWDGFERLDRIFDVVAPFQNLVGRAVDQEKALVDETTPLVDRSDDEKTGADPLDMRRFQDRVTRWGALLPHKADAALKQLEAMESQSQPGGQPAQIPEEAKEQIVKIKEACAKAVELAPEIEKLSGEAAADLEKGEFEEALTKEQETLALLEEIAKLLPEQEQQQKQKEDKEEDQQEKDEEKEQDQPEDRNPDEEEKEKEGEKTEPPPGKELTREEAEAILRQARERERQYQEEKEKARKARAVGGGVEKDW